LVEEGGLSAELSQAVWCGFRRPRGNLVAQSLAAHGSDPLAATLVGRRVSRIAVHPARQREGIGQQLIACACEQAAQCDYLSVSFGYTPELWRFWQRCGFVLVRMGNHREASSGCYTAMALLPLSDAGKRLAQQEHRRLRRDADILTQWNGEAIPLAALDEQALNDEDWRELVGFAFAHRPLLTSLGCLHRLLQYSALPLPALRGRLEEKASDAELCARLRISGRKALLALQRAQAAQALIALDAGRTQRLRDVMPGGGNHTG
ncbi:TPA: tRNA cytosine(34) acetyltransferase TmcA, partial [Salmonella enterica]